MFYYKVSDKTFHNPMSAFLYASQRAPNEFVKFYANERIFDNQNWLIEPEKSFQQLCIDRAHQLRQKYDKIVLAFSGGTDSATIYKVFIDNNIFIDEILITYADKTPAVPISNVKWILEHHKDPRTKITAIDKHHFKYQNYYDNPDWIVNNTGKGTNRFDLTIPGPEIYGHCEQSYPNDNWCLLTGFEKPHIVYENNFWWSFHLDKVFQYVMGYPKLEMFFISNDFPELHIKQNHMLKNYVKRKFTNFTNGWSSTTHCGKTYDEYYEYAKACGRDLDVVPGVSFIQKSRNSLTKIDNPIHLLNNKIDLIKGVTADPFLYSNIKSDNIKAKNFLEGWKTLQSDKSLVNYLTKHKILNSENQSIQEYNGLIGKKYCLGY